MKTVLKNTEQCDAALVKLAAFGDDKAFTKLYLRYARYIAGVVYRLVGDDAELDDIVQEVFIDASESLKKIKNPDQFKSWLVTIAVRKSRRHVGHRAKLRNVAASGLKENTKAVSARSSQEELFQLYEMLYRAPYKLRAPWVLHRLEGFSQIEVAEVCKISLATVKRRITRFEKKLMEVVGN